MNQSPKAIAVIGIIIVVGLSSCNNTPTPEPPKPTQTMQTGPVVSGPTTPEGSLEMTNAALPDLVVRTVSAPTPDTRGTLISVSAVISNQSSTASAGSSFTCFYLNTTTNISGASFLGSYLISGILPHAVHTLSTNVTVPANQPTGQNYFLAVCDCSNNVPESIEWNNTNWVGVTIN